MVERVGTLIYHQVFPRHEEHHDGMSVLGGRQIHDYRGRHVEHL